MSFIVSDLCWNQKCSSTTVNAALSGSVTSFGMWHYWERRHQPQINLSLSDGATWIFNAGKSPNDGGKYTIWLDKGVFFADAEAWKLSKYSD